MKYILVKVKEFCKVYKKRLITIIAIGGVSVIVIGGAAGGVIYNHAKSNIKYSQEQLQEIALKKVPGEVVEVEKEINFEKAVYVYDFKIKDKDNMLQIVKMDSKYGTFLDRGGKHFEKENRDRHGEN